MGDSQDALDALVAEWMASDEAEALFAHLDPLSPTHVEAVARALESEDVRVGCHAELPGRFLAKSFAVPELHQRLGALIEREETRTTAWIVVFAHKQNLLPLEMALRWSDRASIVGTYARRALQLSTDPEARARVLELIATAPETVAWCAYFNAYRHTLVDEAALGAVRARVTSSPVLDTELASALDWGTHPACADEDVFKVTDLLELLARDPRHAASVRGHALRTVVAVLPTRGRADQAARLRGDLEGDAPVMKAFASGEWMGWVGLNDPPFPPSPMPREGRARPAPASPPDPVFVSRLEGRFARLTRRDERAFAAFEAVLASSHEDAEARRELAPLYLERAIDAHRHEQHVAAFEAAVRALEMDRDSQMAALIAAGNGWYAARFEEAMACADHALALDAGERNAHVIRAPLLTDLARYHEAIAAAEAALALESDAMLLNVKAFALDAAGRTEEAAATYAAALAAADDTLAQSPNDADVLSRRAYTLLGLSRPTEALQSALQADAARPDTFLTLQNLGRAHLALGEIDGAIACLERARSSRHAAPLASYYLAVAWAQKGDAARADALLGEARVSRHWAGVAAANPLFVSDR